MPYDNGQTPDDPFVWLHDTQYVRPSGRAPGKIYQPITNESLHPCPFSLLLRIYLIYMHISYKMN